MYPEIQDCSGKCWVRFLVITLLLNIKTVCQIYDTLKHYLLVKSLFAGALLGNLCKVLLQCIDSWCNSYFNSLNSLDFCFNCLLSWLLKSRTQNIFFTIFYYWIQIYWKRRWYGVTYNGIIRRLFKILLSFIQQREP